VVQPQARDLLDPPDPVGHGVGVHVQLPRGALRATVAAEPLAERADQIGAVLPVAHELTEHVRGEGAQLAEVGHLQQQPVHPQVVKREHGGRPTHPTRRVDCAARLGIAARDLPCRAAAPADPGDDGRVGMAVQHSRPAFLGQRADPVEPATALRGRRHHGHDLRVPQGDDGARHPARDQVLGRREHAGGIRRRAPGGCAAVEQPHGEDVMVGAPDEPEVPGPALCLLVVAVLGEQQALDQVGAGSARGRGDHPLAAQDDPADGGRVLGQQEVQAVVELLFRRTGLRRWQRHEVRRDLIADEDRRHHDRPHDRPGVDAQSRQRHRPAVLRGRREDGPERGGRRDLRQPLPRVGRGGGEHLDRGPQHGHGRSRAVRDEPHDAVDVGVLRGATRQVAVYGHQLAQEHVLPPVARRRRGRSDP
jgi:hypothetical protein